MDTSKRARHHLTRNKLRTTTSRKEHLMCEQAREMKLVKRACDLMLADLLHAYPDGPPRDVRVTADPPRFLPRPVIGSIVGSIAQMCADESAGAAL